MHNSICNPGAMESATQGHMIGAHILQKRICRVLSTRLRQSTSTEFGVPIWHGFFQYYQSDLHDLDLDSDLAHALALQASAKRCSQLVLAYLFCITLRASGAK